MQTISKDEIIVTREMIEDYLKTKPDEMFPCISDRTLRRRFYLNGEIKKTYTFKNDRNMGTIEQSWRAIHQKDKYGRCCYPTEYINGKWYYYSCHMCTSKMIYNQTICLKADLSKKEEELKSTNEILDFTSNELEKVKNTLNYIVSLLNEKKALPEAVGRKLYVHNQHEKEPDTGEQGGPP
jgi:hypothetical protein